MSKLDNFRIAVSYILFYSGIFLSMIGFLVSIGMQQINIIFIIGIIEIIVGLLVTFNFYTEYTNGKYVWKK